MSNAIRKLLLFALFSLPCFGTAFTVSQSGNCNVASTFGGAGVPGSGDTYSFGGAFTVTVPAGVTCTIGTGSGTAIDINSANAKLVVNGELDYSGTIILDASGVEIDVTSTTASAITKAVCSAGPVCPTIQGSGQNPPTPVKYVGTAANLAKFTSTEVSSLGGNFNGLFGAGLKVVLQNAIVENCGGTSNTQYCMNLVQAEAFGPNVVFRSSSTVHSAAAGNANDSFIWNGVTFANPTTNDIVWWIDGGQTQGPMSFTNLSFYADLNHRIFNAQNNLYLGPNITLNPGPSITFNGNKWNVVDTMASVGNANGCPNQNFAPNGASWFEVQNYVEAMYSATSCGALPHVWDEAAGGNLGGGANLYHDNVFDGNGSAVDGSGNMNGGDFIVSNGGNHNVFRNISVLGGGNLGDNFTAGDSMTWYNNTLVLTNPVSGYQACPFTMNEGNQSSNPNAVKAITNNIIYGGMSGGCIASTNWTPQTAASSNFDYNNEFSLPSGQYVWNPDQNVNSPLILLTTSSAPYTSPAQPMTAQSGTTSTSLILTGTGLGITVGSYIDAGCNFPVVTAVSQATNTTLTLGQNKLGTTGCSGLTNGTSVTVYQPFFDQGRYWGDGTIGHHDKQVNPNFKGASFCSLATWDTSLGGPGTYANAATQMSQGQGFDSSGNPAPVNASYTIKAFLAYMRNCYTPTNNSLIATGNPIYGTPDIGAVQQTAHGSGMNGSSGLAGNAGVF